MSRLPGAALGWIGVLAVTAAASTGAGLLVHAERTTSSINARTSAIAEASRGIDAYAGSTGQLEQTNRLAMSIAGALLPLTGPTGEIDGRSARIAELLAGIRDATASIDTSAISLDRSAGDIRAGLAAVDTGIAARVGGLNADAARILANLTQIQRGVDLIAAELPATARILDGILTEGRDLLTTFGQTERLVSCIDRGLNGGGTCTRRGR
ncbi:MAG: hypothetical protein ACT4QF_11215 [Sporichthyaceae bacterium]